MIIRDNTGRIAGAMLAKLFKARASQAYNYITVGKFTILWESATPIPDRAPGAR